MTKEMWDELLRLAEVGRQMRIRWMLRDTP